MIGKRTTGYQDSAVNEAEDLGDKVSRLMKTLVDTIEELDDRLDRAIKLLEENGISHDI